MGVPDLAHRDERPAGCGERVMLPLMAPPDRERFLRFVTVDKSGCWLWNGSSVLGGYGRFTLRGRRVLAHRAAYEGTVGPIALGMTLDHLCRRPACANPSHMEPVTQTENNARAHSWWRDRTECINGHHFSDANTRIRVKSSGARVRLCRACQRERMRAFRMRRAI